MAGTSHFADAMRHPRTQVAFAQFAISPALVVILSAAKNLTHTNVVRRKSTAAPTQPAPPVAAGFIRATVGLKPPRRYDPPNPYFYEYPTNSNCVSVGRGTLQCRQFSRQSTWDDASERGKPCSTAHHKTTRHNATAAERRAANSSPFPSPPFLIGTWRD
jgi:hypothetical protein